LIFVLLFYRSMANCAQPPLILKYRIAVLTMKDMP
jgi:hypothetical protein